MSEELATTLALKRRELALVQRRIELQRENAIAFFKPHAKQQHFFANASFRFRYARTGNRFGKSEMGACEDIAFALGYRPWIAEGDPLRTLGIPSRPTKGLIVTTDWDKSKEVFTEQEGANTGKLFRYIPKAALGQPTRNHSGAIDRIPVKHISGGWSIIHLDTVKSYKQNPLGQESSVWDWAHLDEPIPEGMWKAIVRGLTDRGGRAWFTCTPLSEPWIDEAFTPNLEDQSKSNMNDVFDDVNSRFMMTGSMDDNPFLTPEDIELTLSWYTEEEREARRRGIPTAYAGIVYKEFDWNVHVRKNPPPGWASWSQPPKDACIRWALDYHFRKNDAILFTATMPNGTTYVYAELWQPMLVEEEAQEIKRILNGHVALPGLTDPLASTPNKMTETTAMDEYRRLGLAVVPATKDPVNGIRAVKANLKARDKHGMPVLVFNEACGRTMFEISRGFIWDGEENKPVKKNDDMMENLYRLALQGFEYIEPPSDSDYQLVHTSDFADNIIDISSDFNNTPDDSKLRRLAHARRYAR